MHDLVIVGGGPTAFAAAFYAIDKQLDVLLIYEELGGKVGRREGVVRYDEGEQASSTRRYVRRDDRTVLELMPAMPAHRLVRLLVSHVMHAECVLADRVLQVAQGNSGLAVQTRTRGVVQARTVLIATGAAPRRLDVPNAEQLIDNAMDYSIATYAQQVSGQRVAVIGTTSRALLGVVELVRAAAHVTLIVPDPACLQTPLGQALCHHPAVEILASAEVIEAHGSLALEALEVQVDGHPRRIAVDRAFVDLGLLPNSDLVRGLAELDARGYIVVDQHNATATPGLFAAGDVTTVGDEHVLAAIGDGARAAKSAYIHVITRPFVFAQTVPACDSPVAGPAGA